MNAVEMMPAPNESFDVASVLALSDGDLTTRVPFWARCCFADDATAWDDVREAVRGIEARVADRWPGARARCLWDVPARVQAVGRPILHALIETAYRRGPRSISELRPTLGWYGRGGFTVDDAGTFNYAAELRRFLAGWPAQEITGRGSTVTLYPFCRSA